MQNPSYIFPRLACLKHLPILATLSRSSSHRYVHVSVPKKLLDNYPVSSSAISYPIADNYRCRLRKPPKMNNYGLFKHFSFFFFFFCGNLFSISYIIRNTSSVYNGTKAWRINRNILLTTARRTFMKRVRKTTCS